MALDGCIMVGSSDSPTLESAGGTVDAMHPDKNTLQRGPRPDDALRQQFGNLVDSCVDFGTHLQSAFLDGKGKKVAPYRVTAALMLREFHAHLDGTSALLKAGSPESARVALRSAFEAYLNLLYLLSADTERRSLCYALAAKHQVISFVKRRDPSTEQGRQVAESIGKDTSQFRVSRSTDELPTVAELEAELTAEPFDEIEKEWRRINRRPKWYNLYGGPKDLERLADHLKRGHLYDLLYREWSADAHIESVLRNLEHTGPDTGAIPSLRQAEGLQLLTGTAVSLALLCFKDVIDRALAERLPQYLAWYSQEIQSGYAEITSDRDLIRIEKIVRE